MAITRPSWGHGVITWSPWLRAAESATWQERTFQMPTYWIVPRQAAVKMQSALRGKNARFDMQEESRLEWLKYYTAPDVAEWDKVPRGQ